METYIINGHEVEYDTCDIANMEKYDAEVRLVERAATSVTQGGINRDNYLFVIKTMCDAVRDFFDAVIGSGMADKLFYGQNNFQVIWGEYKTFVDAVAATISKDFYSGEKTDKNQKVETVEPRRVRNVE